MCKNKAILLNFVEKMKNYCP